MIITVQAKEDMKGNVFADVLESVKKGWSKFKASKAVTSVKRGLGSAYKNVKELSAKHWKSAALVTTTSFAAGLVIQGALFIPVSAAFYAGVKMISYYNRYKHLATGKDMVAVAFKHLSVGFLSSTGILLAIAPIYFMSTVMHEGFVGLSEVFDVFAYSLIA